MQRIVTAQRACVSPRRSGRSRNGPPAEGGSYVAGDYHVWIHHYAGDLTFAESQATATLFASGSQIAQYTVGSGSGDSSQRIWLVVESDVSATGAVSNVRVQQSFTEGSADSDF